MNKYPDNWDDIAEIIKKSHNYKCERCGHPNDKETGHVLTVHHLDGNKSNCAKWNLAALCQRCHLHIQAKMVFEQRMLPGFEHSEWFIPHLEGYLRSMKNDVSKK